MNEKPVTEALARRFLLGHVDDLERQQIESLFMIDPEVKQTVLLAEEALVEDYLDGTLTDSDTAQFLSQYDQPYQRRKLRIARSIQEYALAESQPSQGQPSAIQRLGNFVSALGSRNRRFLVPVTATVAIILLVAGVWLAARLANPRVQQNDVDAVLRHELSKLNSRASLAETPPQMFSTTLAPVSLRSVQPSVVKVQSDYRIIEFQFLWPQKEEYDSYQALLRRVGSAEGFTVLDLHLEKSAGGSIVKVRLPAQHIAPGLYQIRVSGTAPGSAATAVEEYTFNITR